MIRPAAWSRNPAGPAERLAVHAPWVFISGIALAVTAWIQPDRLPLQACWFLRLTGVPCPFCGTTRAFHAAGNGDWTGAVATSPLGVILYVVFLAIFLFHSAALLDRHRWAIHLLPNSRTSRMGLAVLSIAAILVNWAYRLATGQK